MQIHRSEHALFMQEALELARQAEALGEVPIGAVVVHKGEIVGRGFNRREIDKDPLAHAELIALKEASVTLDRWRLSGCALYVTLEPCPMCAGALVNARLDELYFGAPDPKAGAVETLMQVCTDGRLNHRLKVHSGILSEDCSDLLKVFFKKLRK